MVWQTLCLIYSVGMRPQCVGFDVKTLTPALWRGVILTLGPKVVLNSANTWLRSGVRTLFKHRSNRSQPETCVKPLNRRVRHRPTAGPPPLPVPLPTIALALPTPSCTGPPYPWHPITILRWAGARAAAVDGLQNRIVRPQDAATAIVRNVWRALGALSLHSAHLDTCRRGQGTPERVEAGHFFDPLEFVTVRLSTDLKRA